MASINSPRGGITLMTPRHGTLRERRDPAARSFKVWNIASYVPDLHSASLFVRRSFKQTSKETRLFSSSLLVFPLLWLFSSFFRHFAPIFFFCFLFFCFFLSNTFLSDFDRSMRNNRRHAVASYYSTHTTSWPSTSRRSTPFQRNSRKSARTNGRNARKLNNDLSRRSVHRGRQQWMKGLTGRRPILRFIALRIGNASNLLADTW